MVLTPLKVIFGTYFCQSHTSATHMSYCILSVHKNDLKSGDGKESQHCVISQVPASCYWSTSRGLKGFGIVQLLRRPTIP